MKAPQYTRLMIGLSSLAVLVVVVFNYIVDPFTYYHKPWLAMNISSNQRYGNPGLARQFEYKTVLVGTSHIMELRSDKLSEIMQEPAINLSINGGVIAEQAQLVELILRQKKARTVLWEMNFPSFGVGDNFNAVGEEYPEYFYKPAIETPFRYLMSLDTLLQSLKAITAPHDVNIDNRHQQVPREFSKERVISHWDRQVQRWDASARQAWADYRLTEDSRAAMLKKRVLPIIRQNPEVEFKLFLPPTSMLVFLLHKYIGENEFEQWMDFRNAIAELAGQFPNVEIYDFEFDWASNENLENFRDLEHFDQAVLNNIFVQISRGEMRVDTEKMLANTSLLRKRITDYGRRFCGGNPEHCPAGLQFDAD